VFRVSALIGRFKPDDRLLSFLRNLNTSDYAVSESGPSPLLDHAVKQDEQLRQNGELDMIDDKTVFIVKRT
jgi:hypothetical protein